MNVEEMAKVLRAVFDGMAGAPGHYTERVVRGLAVEIGPHLVIAGAHHLRRHRKHMETSNVLASARALEWARSELARMEQMEQTL